MGPDSRLPRRVTPLGVVVAFIGLTEAILGYGVTQTVGNVQLFLTAFVVTFPILVYASFLYVLWHKPEHLYAPSDYPVSEAPSFIAAIRSSVAKAERAAEDVRLSVAEVVELQTPQATVGRGDATHSARPTEDTPKPAPPGTPPAKPGKHGEISVANDSRDGARPRAASEQQRGAETSLDWSGVLQSKASAIRQLANEEGMVHLRASRNLRELSELEDGVRVGELPKGTYSFSAAEDMIHLYRASRKRENLWQVEVHVLQDGSREILGFVSGADAATLARGRKDDNINFFTFPWEEAHVLVTVSATKSHIRDSRAFRKGRLVEITLS